MTARRQRIAAAIVVGMLALGACGDDDDAAGSTDETTTTAADAGSDGGGFAAAGDAAGASKVAHAIPDEVQVYASASEDEPTTTIANPNENGAPLVFLVEEDLGEWLHVLLPIRPNGSTGYVRAADVDVVSNPYSIDIALSDYRLEVREGDEVIIEAAIGVGTQDTPTPGGKYYIKELLQPPDPNGPYGVYAYGLSGFSNVLEEFGGGDGVIGIHGTNQPELIGQDVSHGCIRVENDTITEMAGILPLGTPVHIEA